MKAGAAKGEERAGNGQGQEGQVGDAVIEGIAAGVGGVEPEEEVEAAEAETEVVERMSADPVESTGLEHVGALDLSGSAKAGGEGCVDRAIGASVAAHAGLLAAGVEGGAKPGQLAGCGQELVGAGGRGVV